MPRRAIGVRAPVAVTPAAGPVNTAFTVGAIGAFATYGLWPDVTGDWQQYLLCGMTGTVAAVGAVKGLHLLVRDYRLRRNLARSLRVTNHHGSAREATPDEMAALSMDDPNSGNLLGLDERGQPVYMPAKTPFSLTEMAPGGGKTSCYVVSSVLHQPFLGKSLFVSDPKLELGPMLAPTLRDLGFEVWCVNPTRRHFEACGDIELNLYQSVLDAVYATDATREDAVTRSQDLAQLHLPEEGVKENLYFRQGSRRCISTAILALALIDPARCTPSDVFAVLNDPAAFLRLLVYVRKNLETVHAADPIVAFLKSEAANLLHRSKKNDENFASFLEGATQSLISFNQGGRLAGIGRTAVHNIADLRNRQIILFVMAPLSHSRGFGPFISILNYNLLAACKQHPAGRPVHIVGEEMLNYRFVDIESDLETMRGLHVSADFYIQSFAGLQRKYGREAAAAIDAYADVKIYAGLNAFDQAKRVSDMLSEATIRKQDYAYKSEVTDLNVTSGELGRRMMTPDEILAMPRDQAWLFVRGLRPTRLTMVHHGQVDPWRDRVGDNPVEGGRLRGDPVLRLTYPERTSR